MLRFLRHGETDWNREGRIQGTVDTTLSEAGQAMARDFARRFFSESPTVIYSSPLARSRHTASAILEAMQTGPAVSSPPQHVVLESLMERGYGAYQGLRLCDVADTRIETAEDCIHGHGVEPWPLLQKRVISALCTIAAGPPSALVIVHGGWYKAMQTLFCEMGRRQTLPNMGGTSMSHAHLVLLLNKASNALGR